ncbi:MAG: methionine--tRNA ligase [Candidatus Shapirobacteria bacterium]|nr:methionine--tRNA ligase [Candidatus Shapirobacteria bacterium]
MNNKKFYITTAIPYVNAAPHIGHALEYVQTDVIARFQKLLGRDVYFLSGTDDNALKNVQAAELKNVPVEIYVKENSDKFENVLKKLNISNDDFIRTTEKRHNDGVKKFWEACKKDIYKKKYRGLYCVGCETFYLEKDLVEGKCPEHKTVPEIIEEENYFFKLSNYQDWLIELIEKDELQIIPTFRKKEILTFIKSGLEDFSISRSVKRAKGWGILVPGDPNQIVYVWFDALINYITALGWPNNKELYDKYWPADVQVIGKGISRFHAIYWPAMLKSAGLPIPKQLFIHGYVTANKEKISKSLGNVIDPLEQIEKYGVDAVRFYLLREIPAYGDGDYSETRFLELYNADLANNWGNLVSRVVKLAEGQNPSISMSVETTPFNERKQYIKLINEFRFDELIKIIFKKYIDFANTELNKETPWKLEKDDPKRIEILNKIIGLILQANVFLEPIMPETSEKIKKAFSGIIKPIEKPLFPRI